MKRLHRFVIVATCFLAHVTCRSLDKEPRSEINVHELRNGPMARITNGNVAEYAQFPYQAGLKIYMDDGVGNPVWCGATVISNRHVLTAAHCTAPASPGLDVYLGAWNIEDASDKRMQIIYVPKNKKNGYIIVHEQWDLETISYDISIIKLPIKIYFNEYVQPAKLPELGINPDYTEQYAIVSGWGTTSDSEEIVTDKLRYAEVQCMSNAACSTYFLVLIKPHHLCIATGSEHTSTCHGDSGGPLVLGDGSNTLIGLTSFASNLGCEQGFPAVFTRISYFGEWIRNHTGIVD